MKIFIILLLAILSITPYALAGEETPQEGVQSIIKLYEEKNFDILIRERYAEIYKAEAEGKVDVLIKRYSQKLSNDEKKLQQIIQILKRFSKVTPVLTVNPNPAVTETDKMAEFRDKKDTYKLYLLKTGKWGFHL